MTVLVRPYGVKGETNDVNLDAYQRMRKKVIFPPHVSFDEKKNAAFLVLGTVFPYLPICIFSQTSDTDKLTAYPPYRFASSWFFSVMRQKNLGFSKSQHQVSPSN